MSEAVAFDSGTFRRVLGHYPTGVCVVTAVAGDDAPTGMVVGSFTSVSPDPPLDAFFPAKHSHRWPRIEKAGKFVVTILHSDKQQPSPHFSSKDENAPGREREGQYV